MPYKKVNYELQQGIHNPPDNFYLKIDDITLHSGSLFLTPTVQITYVRTSKLYETIYDWAKHEKRKNSREILFDNRFELVDIIYGFVDYLALSIDDRKKLFRLYKETQLAKLEKSIDGLNKAMALIWNDEIKLPDIYFKIHTTLKVYNTVMNNLKKRKTGYHQLLYDMLMPLLYKLREYGFSDHGAKSLISDLLDRLGY